MRSSSHAVGRTDADISSAAWAFVLICGMIIVREVRSRVKLRLTLLLLQGMNTPLQTPFLFSPFMMAVIHLVSIHKVRDTL